MNYSIKELSDLFGITTNKARFYEKKGLLRPKRHPENNYRTYTEEDVLKIQTILMYRAIGMPLKQIETLLSSDSNANYLDQFNHLWQLTIKEQQRLSSIKHTLEKIMDDLYAVDNEDITANIINHIKEDQDILALKQGWNDKWHFDNWAKYYDESINKHKGKDGIYLSYDELLDKVAFITSQDTMHGDKVLDIGIGTGNLAKRIIDYDLEVTGVDQSRNMLSDVKNKIPNLKVRLGDFMNIPFDNDSFHRIASTYAFHHLQDFEKELAIDEMLRVLKPSGRIVIGDMMFKSLKDKEAITASMTSEEIDEVNDEFYSLIDHLTTTVKKRNCKIRTFQVDKICWIVEILT